MTTVPRLLEKVYDKIMAKGRKLVGIQKQIFFWAVNLGLNYQFDKPHRFFYNAQLNIANKLVFSKWRAAFGGEMRSIVSGGQLFNHDWHKCTMMQVYLLLKVMA